MEKKFFSFLRFVFSIKSLWSLTKLSFRDGLRQSCEIGPLFPELVLAGALPQSVELSSTSKACEISLLQTKKKVPNDHVHETCPCFVIQRASQLCLYLLCTTNIMKI
jgi:hypothetical protein